MWKEMYELAIKGGFKDVSGRLQRISPGLVELIYLRDDGKTMLECIHLPHDGKRTVESSEINTLEEVANVANGGPISVKSRSAQKDWGGILKKMDPEHWRRDSNIANMYALPQLGGLEHDRLVVGKKQVDDPRMSKLIGNTFWEKSVVPDQKNGGKNNG